MATAFLSIADTLPRETAAETRNHAGLWRGVSARSAARSVLLALVFLAGFTGGAIVGAEGERAVIEAERTLW